MPLISRGLASLPGRTHALYRFYDRTDALLYVGITMDLPQRFRGHGNTKPWWTEVHHVTVEHFSSRVEALAAERAAIRAEHSLYNVAGAELVQVGPHGAGMDLCEAILDSMSTEDLAASGALAREDAEDEGLTLDDLDAADVRARTATAGYELLCDRLRGLEWMRDTVLRKLPAEMRDRVMAKSRDDHEANSPGNYTGDEVKSWALILLSYELEGEG